MCSNGCARVCALINSCVFIKIYELKKQGLRSLLEVYIYTLIYLVFFFRYYRQNGLATNDNLGVELVGGRDDQYYPNDSGIYVSSISKGCIVDGKLKTNDCILRVNNLDCGNVSKRMVIETIRSSGNSCIIMVRRRKIGARSLFTTQVSQFFFLFFF